MNSYYFLDLCHCGCGSIVYNGKKWKVGHSNRGSNNPMYGIPSPMKGKTPWNKGLHWPEDIKIKISSSTVGRPSAFKGKHHSEEVRKINSDFHKTRTGNLNSNWKGGISYEDYPVDFSKTLKEQIRIRDNYTCQLCGKKQKECKRNLDIHHIDYDKKNCKTNNLISLCVSCNTKVNGDRHKHKELFIEKIKENGES